MNRWVRAFDSLVNLEAPGIVELVEAGAAPELKRFRVQLSRNGGTPRWLTPLATKREAAIVLQRIAAHVQAADIRTRGEGNVREEDDL